MRWKAAGMTAGALLLLGGCAALRTGAGAAGKMAATPEAVIEEMRGLELKADFAAYGRCFSEKGKGWLLGELCQGLLWQAYEEDHDHTLGEDAGDMLEKYGLTHLAAEFPEWATEEGRENAWLRLAKKIGNRWEEFLRDYRVLYPVMIFPARMRVAERTQNAGRVVLTLADPRGLRGDIKVYLVKQGGRWVCDGGDAD